MHAAGPGGVRRTATAGGDSGTRELIHVLAGTISMEVGEQSVDLHVDDSLSFPGDVDHFYGNQQNSPARFSLAVYEPGVGTGPQKDSHHA